MNKIKVFTCALLVSLLAASCTRESVPSGEESKEPEHLTFSASLDNTSTKTYLDGVQVKWEATDSVSLWYGTLNTAMTQSDYFVGSIGTDARQATLKGLALSSPDYMAVYPLSASKDCSKKGKLTVELPMKQELKAGSFASKANVSVAYSNTTDLSFKNVGGLLALKVSSAGGHTIKKIRLMGTAAMAGEVVIKQATVAAGEPAVDAINESINFLTLDCGDGIAEINELNGSNEGYSDESGGWSLTKAGTKAVLPSGDNTYYLVSLPGSHTGFALTFVDSDGKTAVARSSYAYTIDRNSNTLIANVSLSDDNFKKDKEIYINEIFCHEDKIELYNAEKKAVDLTGYYFTKDDKKYWAIPAGTTIPAKGYIVFTAGQTDCTLGPTWGLSGDKGFELKLSNGKKVDKIDNTGDGKLVVGETETMGRRTDGADEWVVFSSGTIYEDGVCDGDNSKGTVKSDEPEPVSDSPLRLNELDGNNKYIELYNTGTSTVSLEGVKVYKDNTLVWTGVSGYSVNAGGHVLLYSEDVTGAGKAQEGYDSNLVFSSGLSPKKTLKMELKDSDGLIDTFTRGASPWGTTISSCSDSFGRTPDGTGGWQLTDPTPGTANGASKGDIPQN